MNVYFEFLVFEDNNPVTFINMCSAVARIKSMESDKKITLFNFFTSSCDIDYNSN